MSRLEKAGIEYSYVEMADVEQMNYMYNFLDLYLVTSRHEGGPQAIFECAISKTKIISTDVGQSKLILDNSSTLTGNVLK